MSSFEKTNHAEICPVCQGSGKYIRCYYTTMPYNVEQTCHGCSGKGWVVIQDIEYTVSGGSNE